jgi:hypothetical protein
MSLHDEVAKVAYDLYEKSGRVDGRDTENWHEAERKIRSRHAEQEKGRAKEKTLPAAPPRRRLEPTTKTAPKRAKA